MKRAKKNKKSNPSAEAKQPPAMLRVNGADIPFTEVQKMSPSVLLEGLPSHLQEVISLVSGANEMPQMDGLPQWAKNAAQGTLREIMPAANTSDAYQVGWIYGLALEFVPVFQEIAERNPVLVNIGSFAESFVKAMPQVASGESLQQAGEFYDGAREAKIKAESISDIPHNPKCLAVVWVAWRHFQHMSMAQIHREFIAMKLIAPSTDSRMTRLLLSAIGFPAGKGGRPKSK